MHFKFLPTIRQCTFTVCIGLSSFYAQAQEADISKMGHGKLREYLNEHGYKTENGHIVRVGDTLLIGKGTLPDKRYGYIYQSQTGVFSNTSGDGSTKAYLNSNARGRKAIVKTFMTSGMRKGEYSIFTVVGVGESVNYWIELNSALQDGEILIK